ALEGALLLDQGLAHFAQAVLALVEPALLLAQLDAQLLHLAVELLALLVEVVLGLQFGFFKDFFGLGPRGGGDLRGAGANAPEPGPAQQPGAQPAEGQAADGGQAADQDAYQRVHIAHSLTRGRGPGGRRRAQAETAGRAP